MKLKSINAQIAAISLALMIIDAGPSQAATVFLSGGSNNTCTYTSFTANATGDISITCATNTNNTPPTEVSVCSPTASVNPVNAGAATTLYANCSNAPTGTTYAWTTNPSSGFTATGSSVTVNPSAATTYSVVANNGIGSSAAQEVTVTISVATLPGLLSKTDWVKEFQRLNNIAPNKSTITYLYEYYKTLYISKPSAYTLPGGTLQVLN